MFRFVFALGIGALMCAGCQQSSETSSSSSSSASSSASATPSEQPSTSSGAPSASSAPAQPSGAHTTTASGLEIEDMTVGTGATAEAGKTVSVQYTGWLKDGTKFDSSFDHGGPYSFMLGTGRVIRDGTKAWPV